MALFKLNKEQRRLFADKIVDLAHLLIATMVVGQFISGQRFSPLMAVSGIISFALLYWMSYNLTR